MTKDEALAFDLALEALEVNNQAWKSLADSGDAGFWEAEEQPFYELSVKAITAIKQARSAPTSAEYAMGYAEGFNDGCKPTPVPDPDYWPGTKPVQEPVAFFDPQGKGFYWAKPTKIAAPVTVDVEPLPLYTTPPTAQRQWVGLTDEEIKSLNLESYMEVYKIAMAKLKEKNA